MYSVNTVSAADITQENNTLIQNNVFNGTTRDWRQVLFYGAGQQCRGTTNVGRGSDGKHFTIAKIETLGWSVGPGLLGASASIYKQGTDILIHSTGWKYNQSTTSSHSNSTNYAGATSGATYSGGGYVRIKNGAGYFDQKLPNVNTPRISDAEQREHDELYSKFKIIPAQATNGKIGYIYEEELLGEAPESPEEALRIQELRGEDYFRMIPVYDKDAKTIIGEFRIG